MEGRSTMVARILTVVAAAGFAVSGALGSPWGVPAPSFWVLDLTAAAAFLAYFILPARVAELVPTQGTFDWAGARGRGVPAPGQAKFKYPAKLVVLGALAGLTMVRGYFGGAAILFPSPTLETPATAWFSSVASLAGSLLLWWAFLRAARSTRAAA